MCGINGFVDYSKTLTGDHLKTSTDILAHRGPDDQGYQLFSLPAAQVGLGHRRLAVLDLSSLGHQPMLDESGKYAVVFNGEVYNFSEIRKSLEEAGFRFRSHSDTEVILYGLIHWGMKAIDQFIGMFAIAFLDTEKQKLYLIRDRAGVKPLHFHLADNKLLFSSELKSFCTYDFFNRQINREALRLFFQYGYIPAPHTIFQKTYKLLPGHYLEIDCTRGTHELKKYWDVYDYYNMPKWNLPEEEAIRETEALMHSAFNYRMVADVPVGVFFSGGYDSATLTAILQADSRQKIKTFTIGFHEKEYNEAEHAARIASFLGTEHHEYYCTHSEAAAIIPELPHYFDEPFGDASAIPTMLVSRFARQSVTVALSADAGDELFGGYNRYGYLEKMQNSQKYIPGPLTGIASALLNALDPRKIPWLKSKPGFTNRYEMLAGLMHTKDIFAQNTILSSRFSPKEADALLQGTLENSVETYFDSVQHIDHINEALTKILALDYKTYLPDDILVKVDRAAMSVALEGREPFIDHRLIEWAARLPLDLKIKNGNKKYILKKIAEKHIPATMLQKPKMGFGVPISVWFTRELKELFDHYLSEETVRKGGFLNPGTVTRLKQQYLANPTEYQGNRIWLLLMFQLWWEKWMH